MTSEWLYNNQPFTEIPDGKICFVYLITNLILNKKYYGKKRFYFSKTKQVKGKKKKFKVESDWREYWGSSDDLQKDVLLYGESKFKREILRLCDLQAESSYHEAKYQFSDDVLLYPNSFYNNWISVKITRPHLKRLQKIDLE